MKLVPTIMADMRQPDCRQLTQTMRWRTMPKGIMASSPMRYSQKRKRAKVAAAPQKRPMTSEEPQP